jgi:membrane protein DedA with SNARE-associated domain
MDTQPEQLPSARRSSFSAEGIIGSGITIAALGVLGLLLGSAQWMRVEHESAMIFLVIGALLLVGGAVTALIGQQRKPR